MSEATIKEYKKSFEDELDWTTLDQLHKVVLQISTFCFRTKQVCLTIEIAVIGLLVKFTDNMLDHSVFVTGMVIPLCFWFLDSVSYFYQVKLRGIMNGIIKKLQERNTELLVPLEYSKFIEEKRVKRSNIQRVKDAFFNHSMWMYFFLIVADFILWLLYSKGFI